MATFVVKKKSFSKNYKLGWLPLGNISFITLPNQPLNNTKMFDPSQSITGGIIGEKMRRMHL